MKRDARPPLNATFVTRGGQFAEYEDPALGMPSVILDFVVGCRCQAVDNSLQPGGVMRFVHPPLDCQQRTRGSVHGCIQGRRRSIFEMDDHFRHPTHARPACRRRVTPAGTSSSPWRWPASFPPPPPPHPPPPTSPCPPRGPPPPCCST